MPSLKDTLEQLNNLSQQIHQQSCCNARPSGPYTTAYLTLSAVPDLIRDGSEAERRLFKFIGENENSVKKVEKREGPVTPLKELQSGKAKGGKGEIEVVLRTAARLVDDYRPMPRARNHIAALAEQHNRQLQKIAELERLISELNDPSTTSNYASTSLAPALTPKAPARPAMSTDEAIAAEEESLRSLEAYLKAHRPRPNPQLTSPQKPSENLSLSLSRSRSQRRSPFKPPAPPAEGDSPVRSSRPSIFNSQTPAKTPMREYPHIANSLVAGGPTPHRSIKINRFSPLKNIGSPQKQSLGQRPRGSIFGLGASVPASGAALAARRTLAAFPPERGLQESAEEEEEDQTIMIPSSTDRQQPGEVMSGSPTPVRHMDLEKEHEQDHRVEGEQVAEEEGEATPVASPVKIASPVKRAEFIHGVKVEDEQVVAAISRIYTTFPELLGQQEPEGTEQAITHIHRLSTSEPETSIPNQSHLSPVTRETIYQAFICLLVLQSAGLSVPMSEIKETFGSTMRQRGLGEETDGGKIAWKLVGKKTMRIDRSGAGGPAGSLKFTT